MAYSNLLSLDNAINQILDRDRFSISPREKQQIISVHEYVIFFQAFFENFPQNTKILEARIRDAAAQAEDIIELFLLEQALNNVNNESETRESLALEYQLQRVRESMDSIAAEVVEMKYNITIKDVQLDDSVGATPSSQVAEARKVNMVGFEKDLIEIKARLCGWAPQLQLLPIFGMGGIGKTTLAINAYNDQLIMEHFQIHVWITVSQDYSERRTLLDLLDSMKEFDPELMAKNSHQVTESLTEIHEFSNSEIALKVHKILKGRRFLIVMDDIWSKKVLDDVKKLFPNDNNGSRIMLTTRLTEVATYANSSTLSHEMRLMDDHQSWNLLTQKVFKRQDSIPRELERVGREIARSCGGLPLAIVVIAGLLSTTSNTITSWEEIARNIRSSLAIEDGQMEKILSLSYNHLPHHLRSCFLYMAGFPYHEIKVTHWSRLWIAESFVKPSASKELEDTAEEYLEDLVDRSLIIVTKRKSNGKIKRCRLHDMVREMCIKLSVDEKFLVHVKDMELLESMKDNRRISISHSYLKFISVTHSSVIRTVMYFGDEVYPFKSFRLVRVLDLLAAKSYNLPLPDLFYQLFNLRYFACQGFWGISRVISHLQRLQTLIIIDTYQNYFSYEIWNMPQLRHLLIWNSIRLPNTNATTSTLENLQTLGKVENFSCSIDNLKLIPNLTKLWLTYTFKESGDFLFHNLVHLSRLHKLHLEIEYTWRGYGKPNLVVPISLKKLTLIGWGARGPYINIAGPFPNLEVLKLKEFDFKQRAWRTSNEDFPRLKFLHIEKSNLRQWRTESSHFPKLKTLQVHSCHGLSEIPDCIGEIPTLELIELKLCTNSLVESVKRIQEEAESYGDDVFEVRYIRGKV